MKLFDKTIYIGIDPGSRGALAAINDANVPDIIALIQYNKFGISAYKDFLLDLKKSQFNLKICIESVHSLPRDGHQAAFSFGVKFGEIIGMLISLELPYELYTPRIWQKTYYQVFGIEKTENVKRDIGNLIYEKVFIKYQDKLIRPRAKTINLDLTDSLAIAYSQILMDKLKQPTISTKSTKVRSIAK